MVGGNRTCLYPWIGTLFPEKFFTHEGRVSGTVQQLPDSMECLLQKQYTGIRCRYDLSATCVRFYPVSSSDVWCDAALYDKAEAVSVVTGDHDPECRTACECSKGLHFILRDCSFCSPVHMQGSVLHSRQKRANTKSRNAYFSGR